MQALFTKYWSVAHALLLFFSIIFLPLDSTPVGLWILLAASAFFTTLSLPPIRRGEYFSDARERTFSAILSDPLVWVVLLLLCYTAFQWFNSGMEMVYSYDTKSWGYGKSPLGWGPFAVQTAAAYRAFIGVLVTSSVLIAIRHGMAQGARYGLMAGIAVLAGLAALLFVVQSILITYLGISLPYLPLNLADADIIGFFFSLASLVTCAMVFESINRFKRRWSMLGMFVVAMCQLPVAATQSTLLIITTWIGVLATTIFGLVQIKSSAKNIVRFRVIVIQLGGVVAMWALCFTVWSWSPQLVNLFKPAVLGDFFANFGTQWIQRAELALAIWQDYPWCGVGPSGYANYAGFYAKIADWSSLPRVGEYVQDAYLRLLVEQGLVGTIFYLGIVGILISSIAVRLMIRFTNLKKSTKSAVTDSLQLSNTPGCLWIAVAVAAVQMLISEPLNHPVNFLLWCVALALSANFVKTGARRLAEKRS